MKKMEFKCASNIGKGRNDTMIVKNIPEGSYILFKNTEYGKQYENEERHANICLSKKDSLILAGRIINEFCNTRKTSKKVLKMKIAVKDSSIMDLIKSIELKDDRIKMLEQILKETNPCIDDTKNLNI
jgi:hypothetical protein